MSDGSSGLQRFQTTGHGWEGLGAPERQGGKVLGTQPPAYRAHRPSGLKVIVSPAFIFPTSISSLPGLLTPKPGAEFKILPYALTAGNKEQKEAIKMYPLRP